MNKKFLSAILFGALMVTSTGTFVSCKDYDDDIDAINKELTDVKSQIAALQAKVDAGKWITSVSSNAAGVTINLSDGSSVNITNGKDGQNGAQGEAGKDGKDGSVVEVKDGVLYINGEATEIKVAEEAPAALPCVKVENGELMILGENNEYVASGIKACSVVAVKENGVWTITTADGESIVVPGAAALTSISIQGGDNLVYNYGYFTKDVEWGFKGELKTAEAGFYSRLSKDVEVLLNPAEADGTAFTYTFRNSVKAIEDLTFFGEARPSTAVLTRAASGNGVWTLPAAVTKHAATSITELRNELYLNFKQNDDKYYAMSLEATDLLGNTAVRSDYEYKITLNKASDLVTVDDMNCLVGQEYYPVVNGAVIDYQIRVYPSVANNRMADAFGIEITEDGKGFIANNESAVYNGVKFQVAYVTINGTAKTDKTFTASFKDEFSSSEEVNVSGMNKPFDAAPIYNASGVFQNEFVMYHTYDLNKVYENASEEVQMILDENFKATQKTEIDLIGGESDGDENYNELNRNELLESNIGWSYNAEKKELTVAYYVSAHYEEPEDYDADATGMSWVEYSNFQLNTAYQLNIMVSDAGMELAKIELPFELDYPTLDIQQVDGDFTKWGNVLVDIKADGTKVYERALYVYGFWYTGAEMKLPLYDSFTAWKAKGSQAHITRDYQEHVENARYYDMVINALTPGTAILGQAEDVWFSLNPALEYAAKYKALTTYANTVNVKAVAKTVDVDGKQQKEFRNAVEVNYKHYGVYQAKGTTEYKVKNGAYDYSAIVDNNEKVDNDDFHLVYASWLKHSNLEMAAETYRTARGSHVAFITNDDLNFTTPKGDNFYLFNDISATGKIVERADLNASFNEVDQYPFTTVTELFTSANKLITWRDADGADQTEVPVTYGNDGNTDVISEYFDIDLTDGEVTLNLDKFTPSNNVQVYSIRSVKQQQKNEVATGVQQAFQGGIAIVLPQEYTDGQSAVVTLTLMDKWGYKNSVEINVTKLGN